MTTTTQNLLTRDSLPEFFRDADHLDDFMSLPTAETVADLAALDGDVMILGVAGKMGISLARMIKAAAPGKRVIGVSRFSESGSEENLRAHGVETIRCDLLDRAAVEKLPRVANIIYMAGLKFDYRGREDFLWAMNTLAPAIVADTFRDSRIVALSTIHVYPWSDPRRGGVDERTPPVARPGEYANSVVGRERTFQYFSGLHGTPGRLVRFVYAVDMRYGALQEIASWVRTRTPIPLATGNVNVQWQGDAINHFARLLRHVETPATPINIGGPECVSVRHVAERFGQLFDIDPIFEGTESDHLLFVNCDQAADLLGNPTVTLEPMLRWIAEWVENEKPLYGKPSKFEVRNGIF
ncbi:nucleoside-diphosphate-sugar epimerase [Microbacterium keratanolyticum]|uniref:Epimerase n=1 Tax=Microbacterium keratanolyticum TaxID=67574 RepID=A0A9W6HQS8_9MICO|nr:NAD(P)-dependent oxidoreductase [Microbacterium keratanolyticum]MBM7469117.1 nucleoside-diphosphate-sugar epimerase [Microbacterium keratanolyticum]GLK01197.1 epimerase [Microbacterium keratanolyticum]